MFKRLTTIQNVYRLFPIAVLELFGYIGRMKVIQDLESLLIFGNYPEVVNSENSEQRIRYLINPRNNWKREGGLHFSRDIRNLSRYYHFLNYLS